MHPHGGRSRADVVRPSLLLALPPAMAEPPQIHRVLPRVPAQGLGGECGADLRRRQSGGRRFRSAADAAAGGAPAAPRQKEAAKPEECGLGLIWNYFLICLDIFLLFELLIN